MKVYIAGKIRGLNNHKEIFKKAEDKFLKEGDIVLNPSNLPEGMEQADYMDMCLSMVRSCDILCLLPNWEDSEGAKIEASYAKCIGKEVKYLDDKYSIVGAMK